MRILWLYPKTTVEALSAEEAILRLRLEGKSSDTLCFWQGKRSLVVGCDRNRDKVDFQLCAKYGIPIYRRQSGGGAIYQEEGNLNYSLIAPLDKISPSKDIQSATQVIDSLVAKAISQLNLRTAVLANGGVGVEGRKFSGSAQFVLWGYLLHHGVIAVNTDLKLLSELISTNKVTVTTLERELGHSIEMVRLAGLIRKEFAANFNTTEFQGKLSHEEEVLAQELLKNKYLTSEWSGCLYG